MASLICDLIPPSYPPSNLPLFAARRTSNQLAPSQSGECVRNCAIYSGINELPLKIEGAGGSYVTVAPSAPPATP